MVDADSPTPLPLLVFNGNYFAGSYRFRVIRDFIYDGISYLVGKIAPILVVLHPKLFEQRIIAHKGKHTVSKQIF